MRTLTFTLAADQNSRKTGEKLRANVRYMELPLDGEKPFFGELYPPKRIFEGEPPSTLEVEFRSA